MRRRNVVASLLLVALSAVLARSSSRVVQNEGVTDSGRPVVGRMVLPTDFKGHIDMAQGHGSLVVGIPPDDFPAGYDQMTSSQKRAFLKKWWSSSEAKEAERTRMPISFNVLADGTFRIKDIEPGWYTMFLRIMELRTTAGAKHHVVLASAHHKFEVPEMSTDRSNESLDVGTIELNVYRQFQVGEQAPDFAPRPLMVNQSASPTIGASICC